MCLCVSVCFTVTIDLGFDVHEDDRESSVIVRIRSVKCVFVFVFVCV